MPADAEDGDLLEAIVVVELASATITAPDGWGSLVSTPLAARSHTQAVYVRRANAEPASYTWEWSAAECSIVILAYRNADYPQQYEAQANNVNSAECAAPAIETDIGGSLVQWIGSSMSGATWTPPGDYTERGPAAHGSRHDKYLRRCGRSHVLGDGRQHGGITGTASVPDFSVGTAIAFAPLFRTPLTDVDTTDAITVSESVSVAPIGAHAC